MAELQSRTANDLVSECVSTVIQGACPVRIKVVTGTSMFAPKKMHSGHGHTVLLVAIYLLPKCNFGFVTITAKVITNIQNVYYQKHSKHGYTVSLGSECLLPSKALQA